MLGFLVGIISVFIPSALNVLYFYIGCYATFDLNLRRGKNKSIDIANYSIHVNDLAFHFYLSLKKFQYSICRYCLRC